MPAVNVAAVGVAPVDPIISWPLVIVEEKEGAPEEFVTSAALFAVANPVILLAVTEYKSSFIFVPKGYTPQTI